MRGRRLPWGAVQLPTFPSGSSEAGAALGRKAGNTARAVTPFWETRVTKMLADADNHGD